MGIPLHLLRGRKSIFTRLLASKNNEFVGAFGKINAIYGVIEAQGSGGLHIHFHAWGQLDHRRMGRFLHDPKFRQHVIDFIDKIVTAEIPDELLDPKESQKKTIIAAEPYPNESSYRLDAGKCRLKVQHHKHSATCWKRHKQPKCRMSMKRQCSILCGKLCLKGSI